MKYKEALSIAPSQGVIQCTYATIHDEQGNRLFSLQNVKASEKMTLLRGDTRSFWVELSNKIYWDANASGGLTAGDADVRGGITIKIPLVIAYEYSKDRLVPVRLTEEARNLIAESLLTLKTDKYSIYLYENGLREEDKKLIQTTYTKPTQWQLEQISKKNNGLKVTYTTEKALAPKYEKLMQVMKNNEIVYVKPAAFDWSNTSLSFSREKDLDTAIAQAKKKMDAAKALLAGAAITNIF